MNSTSYEKPKPPPPQISLISGNVPGVLDPTQPSRLLRHQESVLSFASFDPYIATPHELNINNLSMDDKPECRPKRIVIETIPDGRSFWRWVPSARKQQDVDDEGAFPRMVDICGTIYNITQEQWDIYKLDQRYDCFVRYPPSFSVISVKAHPTFEGPASAGSIPRWNSSTGSSFTTTSSTSENDPDRMIVDDDDSIPFNPLPTKPLPNRKRRASPRTPHHFDFSATQSQENISPGESSKRTRSHSSFQSLRPTDEEENIQFVEDMSFRNTKFYVPKIQKRHRTLSPRSKHRTLEALKSGRKNAKKTRWDEAMKERRDQEESRHLRELYSQVPPAFASNNDYTHFTNIPEEDEESMGAYGIPPRQNTEPEEDTEEKRIAESKRKMAELNSDRQRQREREIREGREEARTWRARTEGIHEEEEKQRKKFEEEKRRREKLEEARQKEEARQEEFRQSEEARLWRKHQEDQERARSRRQILLEKLYREREERHKKWYNVEWTHARAIDRYQTVSKFFDEAKFSAQDFPLMNIDIPWPTLRHPSANTPDNVDWASVTEFFEVAKKFVRGQAYIDLRKSSQHRFHPDRWLNRKRYDAILDDQAREEVKTGVNTVSQAIGCLIDSDKSKSA